MHTSKLQERANDPVTVQHPFSGDLIVQPSRNGQGICTARDFAAEETLFEVTGKFISGDEDEELSDAERDNAFRFDTERYITPAGSIGDYLNHSCEPNAKVVKRSDALLIVAAAPIRKGTEVAIDYSTITADDDIWEMQCNCGSETCRGIIKSFNTLPVSLRKKYLARGMVPAYVAKGSEV